MHQVDREYEFEGLKVTCSLYLPDETPRGVILLGHGLGVDIHDETIVSPASYLAGEHNLVVFVPELPLHGARADAPVSNKIANEWQEFWAGEGRSGLLREWQFWLKCVQE